MLTALRQKLGQYTKAALAAAMQNSGIAALYLCSSTFLAALLTVAVLSYAWDIDREQWYRALAILRGVELAEIQKAEKEQAAKISHEEIVERRAIRTRQQEFDRELTGRADQFLLPPADPGPPPPPPPSEADRISAYEQRVKADVAQSQSDGLAELTQTLNRASPDWAKEVIRRFWKDGHNRLVLQALLDLEEKPREKILFSMQTTKDEELKDLCEILLRIAAGEPRTSILKEAAEEPESNGN